MSSARGDGPPERTALSWQRTELSVALVGAFVAAAALRLGVVWVGVVAGAFALAGVAVAVAGRPREAREGREEVAPWPWLPRIAVATAVVGLLGAALGAVEVLRNLA
ncbi:MAG: DUF202 domain-containing protein [Actinomycetales bacterium]|nr:DUF202 domain-containing protein [Actinomycetales bacterium]